MIANNGLPEVATAERSFYFQWHFLERCNLRCQHCYQNEYVTDELGNDDLLRIAKAMEIALQQWRYAGRISITGGEPLLAPEKLCLLLDFFENSNPFRWIGILTNGTLIDEAIVGRFSTYSKLKEVQVSLDGATEQTHDAIRGQGNYTRALKGLGLLRAASVPTSIMFTATQHNVHEASSIIDLAMELGVGAITIERATPIGPRCDASEIVDHKLLRSTYEAIAARKKCLNGHSSLRIRTSRPLWCLVDPELGGFCPAGFSCLAILHNGDALPCRRLEIPVGNILKDGIFSIWYTSKILWQLRDKSLLAADCQKCAFVGRCGGCRASAYAMTGDMMARDPQCWKE